MAPFAFNVSKGRHNELVLRVKNNDPSTSALILVLLAYTGLEAQSVLEDADTLAAVVAGATNEAANTNYARITLTDSDLGTIAQNDTSNYFGVDIADQTYANLGTGRLGAFLVCWDGNTGAGTDSDIIPMTFHPIDVSPSSQDVKIEINTNGLWSAF